MVWLYGFAMFFQPGVFWPALAPYSPIVILSIMALFGALSRPPEYSRRHVFNHPALLFLAVFLVVNIVSVYYSGVAAILEEAKFWYQYLAFMLVSALAMGSTLAIRRFVMGMIFGAMIVIYYGIYAALAGLPSSVKGMAGAYGMYENHNDYTFLIILVLPFIYVMWRQSEGVAKKLLFVFMLSGVAGVAMSLSRGGMVALVFEVLLIVGMSIEKDKRARYLVLMLILGGIGIGYQFIKRAEVNGSLYTVEDSSSSRFELWEAAKNMVLVHPILGVGSRRFHEFARQYGEISHDNWGKNAHNTYMEIAADTGLLGLTTFLAFVWFLARDLKRYRLDSVDPNLEQLRIATRISFYSILLRALLDAKAYDWSFYVLCAIGVVLIAIGRTAQEKELGSAAKTDPVQARAPEFERISLSR